MIRSASIQQIIPSTVLILPLLLLAGCGGGESPEEPAGAAPTAARIQEGYAGSEVCAGCHAQEFEAWSVSRHRAIFRPGGTPAYQGAAPPPYKSDTLVVVPAAATPPPDAAAADGPRPALRVEKGGATGTFPVDAVMGGKRLESYATRLEDGAWLLLPLSYQVEQRAFRPYTDGTCGVEALGLGTPMAWQAYDRVWNHRCIDCHVTAGDIGFDTASGTYRTSWVDPGAGCEACHGPGEAHVEAARAGRGGEGILGLAELESPGQVEVCGSCHALSFPFESRWGGNRPYRPGDRFQAAFLPLLRPQESEPFTLLTHADRTPRSGVMEYQGLTQSLCFLRGGATCSTCHDPHGGAAAHALRAPAGSADLCAGCHQDVVAAGEKHSHHAAGKPGGACVDCHMPPTVEALGTRLASHAIDVPVPASQVDYGIPDACTLCHGDRGAKWAATQFKRLWGDPEGLRRRRLARAFNGPDAAALRALLADTGEADLLRADAAAALARLEGLAAAPQRLAALADGSSLLLQRYAADLLGGLGARADLGLTERAEHFGRLQEAGVPDALRRAADTGPAALRLAAASALARLGTSDGLARLESLRADPELDNGYRLHQALGKYYLLGQKLAEAAEAYERVLRITPNHLSVIEDLGFVYFTTQRFQEARDLWMRGLTLNPANEDLRLKVHLAEDQLRSRGQLPPEAGG